jgi:hypothetical protein
MCLARPSRFSVSQRATAEMKAFLRSYQTDEPRELFIIGLALGTRVVDGKIVGSGPGVGIERRSNVREDDIVVVDGVEIALSMTEREAAAFTNSVLEFEDGRFILRSN